MNGLNSTPSSNRTHIGFYGRRNSGKSSLINAFSGHNVSIVSAIPGTTTDPVRKAMEINGIGPCVLIDTAGFDDDGELGRSRVKKTEDILLRTDVAVLLFTEEGFGEEMRWFERLRARKTPVLPVISKADALGDVTALSEKIKNGTGVYPVVLSSVDKRGFKEFKERLISIAPDDSLDDTVTGKLVSAGDIVLLVMPQDKQAPKGRLILPEAQMVRELIDKKCIPVCTDTENLEKALDCLKEKPKLIITDSQAFKTVYAKKPEKTLLTSFSALLAAHKGDIDYYCAGARTIDKLTEKSKVLIAECCTHAPMSEDIGREQIPNLMRKRIGKGLTFEIVSGSAYPEDLSPYDLIIQCGACMFNKKYVTARVDRAKSQKIPMTNYGVVLAYLNGILDKISF